MTPDETRDTLFLALTDCADGRGEPILKDTQTARKLAFALFDRLTSRGLLKREDDND
jgi:hypothetical protein